MQARKNKGNLFIVSAPSGTGKTTLCANAISIVPNLSFSVSYTTRRPRPGETNDKDYTFISREHFQSMIEANEFVEWAEVHGHLYGTSKNRLDALLNAGSDVILDIDTQGALQMKNRYPEGVYIFILPPSLEVLRARLEQRRTDAQNEIKSRIQRALSEIQAYDQYDYVIINDILEVALKELMSVIIAQRARVQMINPLWIQEFFYKREET